VDNIGNLAGLVAIGVRLRGRRRHKPDSSLAGGSCDRLGVQPGRWPTTDGLSCVLAERHTEGVFREIKTCFSREDEVRASQPLRRAREISGSLRPNH
jgi:hypothetical protein